MNRLRFHLICIVLFISCKDKDADIVVPRYDLQVTVNDEFGEPMDSVACVLSYQNQKLSTTTDQSGNSGFRKIQAGKYMITYSKAKYITGNDEVDVSTDPTVVVLTLSAGTSFLRSSDSLLTVGRSSGERQVRVESNMSWSVTSDAHWISTSSETGAGNSNLQIMWEGSDEMSDRVGTVVIKTGSIQRKIKVVQFAPVKLMSQQGVIGNYENGVTDSIRLVFNKPISASSITTSYELCLSDIKYKVYANTLSFSYACARLGGDYPFTVKVKDKSETFTFPINIKFYEHKTTIPGYILDYFITDDNKFIWGVTNFPNKVIKLSMPDLTVVKTYDMNFEANLIRWNAFRKKLNIFKRADRCYFEKVVAGECDNNLIYLDPETGEVTRSRIKLISGYDGDNFGYPYVFPYDLSLFEDGTGIIQLENEYNYAGWRFINSENSDSTYISERHLNPPHDMRYGAMHINYNKNEIYLMHPWGSTSIEIFEKKNQSFRTYTSPVFGRSNSLVINKKNNRVYHGQLYEQFVSDLGDYVSKISYLDNRPFYGGVDFSYKEGEDETIYFLQDGLFQILNYKIGFTSISCDTHYTLTKIQSTTDGKNFVALKQNNEGTTDLFVFNIDTITLNKAQEPNEGGRMATGVDVPFPSRWHR